MTSFSFVHAADVHLDAPLRGLARAVPSDLPGQRRFHSLLREAGFLTLARLTAFCLDSGADFLLLAGDVYNSADSSLRARLALRDSFLRLQAAGVRVFLAHGNHDPLRDEPGVIPWPDNVTVFGDRVTAYAAHRRGADPADPPVALVHGISHSGPREGRNLARQFRRRPASLPEADVFQIGLLHCALADMSGPHEAYAPCSFADLAQAELDYWALGHVHAPRVLDRRGKILNRTEADGGKAFAAYAGSLQGLHINETGPHGCLLVRVEAGGRTCARPVPLAALRWEQLDIAPGPDVTEIPTLERTLLQRLEDFAPLTAASADDAADAAGASDAADASHAADAAGVAGEAASAADSGHALEGVLVRLTLSGRTPLNHELRMPGAADALADHLNAELSGSRVWIRDILPATRPMLDLEATLARADLAGEALRLGLALRDDPVELERAAERALSPFFRRARLRKALTEPGSEELAALVEEAAFLCLDLLGSEEQEAEPSGDALPPVGAKARSGGRKGAGPAGADPSEPARQGEED